MKDIQAMKESSVAILPIRSIRGFNYLKRLGIETIGELAGRKELDNPFVYISTSESKAAQQIIEAMSKLGLHLDMSEDDWQQWSTSE